MDWDGVVKRGEIPCPDAAIAKAGDRGRQGRGQASLLPLHSASPAAERTQ